MDNAKAFCPKCGEDKVVTYTVNIDEKDYASCLLCDWRGKGEDLMTATHTESDPDKCVWSLVGDSEIRTSCGETNFDVILIPDRCPYCLKPIECFVGEE